jgi:hypothetical protein
MVFPIAKNQGIVTMNYLQERIKKSLAQPVANEYLRNSASLEIMTVSSIITSVVAPTALKPIKDGGANDTDGTQSDNTGDANGVVASTISSLGFIKHNSPCCLYNI